MRASDIFKLHSFLGLLVVCSLASCYPTPGPDKSVAGAVLGAMLGLPIPVIGPPLAALLGGAAGALAGAALAELTRGETSSQSLRVGGAAFLGRLLGTGAKTLIATVLAVLAVVALIV